MMLLFAAGQAGGDRELLALELLKSIQCWTGQRSRVLPLGDRVEPIEQILVTSSGLSYSNPSSRMHSPHVFIAATIRGSCSINLSAGLT